MSRGPDAATLLARALTLGAEAAGCPIRIAASDWQRWASATFRGARHTLTIEAAPSLALDAWLAGLPETEFTLRGNLVADLTVERVVRAEQVTVEIEALTLEER